jgi:predicted aconitase
VLQVSVGDLIQERDRLSTACTDQLDVIAVGSPHFSVHEFQRLLELIDGRKCLIPIIACTNRYVVKQLEEMNYLEQLSAVGVELIVDTCVVVTPILPKSSGVLMTNSGKFAHYSPPLTGYEVVLGSLEECVSSALAGIVVRHDADWQ